MAQVEFKLKQASAVAEVPPKELQNFVQFGVLKPRRCATACWFDTGLLLQAKVAWYIKCSLDPSTAYLAKMTQRVAEVPKFGTGKWESLLVRVQPAKGRPAIEVRIPVRELYDELMEQLPNANAYRDLPRGRKRAGWKKEFITAVKSAAGEMQKVSEADIVRSIREYRRMNKRDPEMTVVAQAGKTA
jgi:hypothetical protein